MKNIFTIHKSGRLIIEAINFDWVSMDELEEKLKNDKEAFYGLGIGPVVYSLCQDGYLFLVEVEGTKMLRLSEDGHLVMDAIENLKNREKR